MGSHHHDHSHSGHARGHGQHTHGPSHGVAFAVSVTLNLLFVVAEIIAGIIGGSTALLADAGHNFADVLALILAWLASRLAARPPSARFTYGLKASSILAALANAALLWVALGAILIETLRQFAHPAPVQGMMMITVATA